MFQRFILPPSSRQSPFKVKVKVKGTEHTRKAIKIK
jgi:hypothetical protein